MNAQRSPGRHAYIEVERLMGAAARNPALATLLVAKPAAALATWDHRNRLSAIECALLCSISGATDLHDFTTRLHRKILEPSATKK